jgi:hypothetical protein
MVPFPVNVDWVGAQAGAAWAGEIDPPTDKTDETTAEIAARAMSLNFDLLATVISV